MNRHLLDKDLQKWCMPPKHRYYLQQKWHRCESEQNNVTISDCAIYPSCLQCLQVVVSVIWKQVASYLGSRSTSMFFVPTSKDSEWLGRDDRQSCNATAKYRVNKVISHSIVASHNCGFHWVSLAIQLMHRRSTFLSCFFTLNNNKTKPTTKRSVT